jgi:hypothetical protein
MWWQNSGLWWFGCHIARLEFVALLYLARIAGKSPGNTLCQFEWPKSVHHLGLGLASSGVHPQNQPFILNPQKAEAKKNEMKLNSWRSNSPTHTNRYFSGLPTASIRHECLHIEKTATV